MREYLFLLKDQSEEKALTSSIEGYFEFLRYGLKFFQQCSLVSTHLLLS